MAAQAPLATLDDVREYLKIEAGDTEDDVLLSALITRLSALTADFLGRTLPSAAGTNPVTEHLNGQNTPFVQLKLYPAEDTTSVKQSLDQDWGAADELLTEVILDEENGIVKLKTGVFFRGFRNVQVIHDHSEVRLLGLEQKIIEMVAKAYNEKENLGVVSLSLKDGSMTKKLAIGAIFEEMKKELAPYGNPSGVI